MALNAFLQLTGTRQGAIKGSVTQKGHEGNIMVIAVNHEIKAPFINPGSGAGVGKRMHTPFVITKELDKSSPVLYQAMAGSEMLNSFELNFYTAAVNGIERKEYTIVLSNSMITDIKFILPNTKEPDSAKLNPYEIIEFTYQSIQWTWADGGITAIDKWI